MNLLAGQDYHSTAFNFFDHIRGSVDPRTGMYSASIDLATGEGNGLRGPSFEFCLAYSTLDSSDEGFGKGWHIRMTRMDRTSKVLSLASGEAFVADAYQPGVKARFSDRKLETFVLVPGPALTTARIDYTTGLTELLALPGGLGTTLKPVRIVNQTGEGITLEWSGPPSGPVRLTRIVDDEGVELLRLEYANADETILMIAGAPGAESAQFRFVRAQDWLDRIELTTVQEWNAIPVFNDAEQARWNFRYENSTGLPQLVLLSEVVHPTGITERVKYKQDALLLPPGASRTAMPAVVERTQCRTSNTDHIIEASLYRYDVEGFHNFYGYGVVTSWSQATDQLLHLVGADRYRYGSEETRLALDQKRPLLTIRRRYNQFHLIVEETTTRGTVVNEVITKYGNTVDVPFSQQPAAFQLPHEVTQTRYDVQYPELRMVTHEKTSYNEAGSVTSHDDSATGLRETSTYYPVAGELDADGAVLCPADPLGLVRRLKETRTCSGPRMPVRIVQYHYVSLDARSDVGRPERTSFVQCARAIALIEDASSLRVVESKEREFVSDRGPWHGCLASETHLRDGRARRLSYRYDADASTITTVTSLSVGPDELATQSEALYRVTGLVAEEIDVQGRHTAHAYDPMGRLIRTVLHPDKADYRSEIIWRYQVSATARWTEHEIRPGYIQRTWLDERGLAVHIEAPLEDGQRMFMRECSYNTLGDLVIQTDFDRIGSEPVSKLTTTYEYDHWGGVSRIIHPDLSEDRNVTSLVYNVATGGTDSRTVAWKEAAGERLDWVATDTNVAGRLVRRGVGPWEGSSLGPEEAFEAWEYDGLGRCVVSLDARGLKTSQTWDDDDRLIATHLNDGTVVTRSYARGSSEAVLANIEVTTAGGDMIALGSRQFDALWRIRSESVGGLDSSYDYEGPGPFPARSVQPSGAVLEMTRDVPLGDCLVSATLTEPGGTPVVTASASYDRATGEPQELASANATLFLKADRLGRLVEQTMIVAGDEARSTSTTLSAAGREVESIGADGTRRRLIYDEVGRPSLLSDTDVTVSFAYDTFSRLSVRTSYAMDGRSVSDTRRYDARGRVISQAWLHTDGSITTAYRLEFDWHIDNKLAARRWWRGEALSREETYGYDNRGRLAEHTIRSDSGDYPLDEMGRAYTQQVFVYDALDNLTSCETWLFAGGGGEITRYVYDDANADRLVEYTRGSGAPVRLTYDDNGNLIDDGRGMSLGWDGAGRLAWVRLVDGTETYYSHGPGGRVCATRRGERVAFRHYSDGVLVYEVSDGDGRRYIRVGGRAVAECVLSGAIRKACLLGVDAQGSVVMDDGGTGAVRDRAYGAYGYHPVDRNDVRLGFAGEVLEDAAPFYLLGTRAYSPVLRRFLSPDPASPFGEGGLNRYAYCGGDPINRIDPSGQSWLHWFVAIGSLVVSVVAAVVTGGALIGAVGAAAGMVSTMGMVTAVSAAVLDTVALAVDIGAVAALATGDEQAWQILGTVGMFTGLASIGASTAIKSAGKVAGKLAGKGASKAGRAGRMSSFAHQERPRRDLESYANKTTIRRAASIEDLPKYQNSKGEWRPIPQWSEFRKPVKGGQSVHYGANSPVTSQHVASKLNELIAEKNGQTIYVYSGAHGVPDGANFRPGGQRRPSLNEKELFERDEADLSPLGAKVVDMTGAKEVDDYVDHWEKPGIHIHGYCFAAVDIELLSFFGITEKVTVYI